MTEDELNELQRLAEAATPDCPANFGHAECHRCQKCLDFGCGACAACKSEAAPYHDWFAARDRFRAAANPETVKALIAEVRRLQESRARVVDDANVLCEHLVAERDALRAENERLCNELAAEAKFHRLAIDEVVQLREQLADEETKTCACGQQPGDDAHWMCSAVSQGMSDLRAENEKLKRELLSMAESRSHDIELATEKRTAVLAHRLAEAEKLLHSWTKDCNCTGVLAYERAKNTNAFLAAGEAK